MTNNEPEYTEGDVPAQSLDAIDGDQADQQVGEAVEAEHSLDLKALQGERDD
jgi:hypothetical protein